MEHKIIQKEKNHFLEREEISIELTAESTPSFSDVKAILKKDEKLVVVRKIKSNFGKKSFIAEVVVYDSEDAKKQNEIIPRKTKLKLAEEEKKRLEEEKKAKEEAKKAEETKSEDQQG